METQGTYIEVGSGELIDKITILEIKAARISDADKLVNVRHELAMLEGVRDKTLPPSNTLTQLAAALKSVNEELWQIEDDIRAHEAAQDFGDTFIGLARAVYKTNDKRAALKKEINLLTGAAIIEEKSYTEFE
ncbi:MAG: hypothetical protein HAW64_01350 [Alphaproteobacteria bacterium]|nr:hypothetical protein [Alphaproteobacteria bacterium]